MWNPGAYASNLPIMPFGVAVTHSLSSNDTYRSQTYVMVVSRQQCSMLSQWLSCALNATGKHLRCRRTIRLRVYWQLRVSVHHAAHRQMCHHAHSSAAPLPWWCTSWPCRCTTNTLVRSNITNLLRTRHGFALPMGCACFTLGCLADEAFVHPFRRG